MVCVTTVTIANCSGFFGDRMSALREVVEGGPIDVVTGDYLAELTMLILWRTRFKDPSRGYASTFLRQLEPVLGTVADRGIKVVVNAGGLAPAECAQAVRDAATAVGADLRVAHVEGDDLLPRVGDLHLPHLDTGEELGHRKALTANAYLGAWGIAAALDAGAQVVITGRVTDASLVVGPAASHFGWARDDWDRLAGAVVAGHLIECGPQVTGGNYAFFREIAQPLHLGFPLAEISDDGSCVITKHPGTGGLVDVGTVTAQLLYEIQGPVYDNPDVRTHLRTVALSPDGPDRVRVSGVHGSPPSGQLKVALNMIGGFRNRMEFVLTGLEIEAKAGLALRQLSESYPHPFEHELVRSDHPDAITNEGASALLRVSVRTQDQKAAGRAFSGAAVELALSSYPGFTLTSPPGDAEPYGRYWPCLVDAAEVEHVVVHPDGRREVVAHTPGAVAQSDSDGAYGWHVDVYPEGETRRVPLGTVLGARSGDKGGNANIGLWARTDQAARWLSAWLTRERVRELLPEAADLELRIHHLPNLRAVNVVVVGLLGEGVAGSTRFDPQAKSLGEYVRSRLVDVPVELL